MNPVVHFEMPAKDKKRVALTNLGIMAKLKEDKK